LFDVYTQRSEYEARLKVQRLKRDVDLKTLFENEEIPEFRRNIKIVNVEEDEFEESMKTEDGKNKVKVDIEQELKDFIGRSRNVLDSYYERAFINDKLGGLDSKEIIHRIKVKDFFINNTIGLPFEYKELLEVDVERIGQAWSPLGSSYRRSRFIFGKEP